VKRLMRFVIPAAVVLSGAAACTGADTSGGQRPESLAPTAQQCPGEPVAFKDARLIVETNATDGDAGLQVFMDHDPWRRFAIYKPDGSVMLDITTSGDLVDYGLTELFSESSEPPFIEFPLEQFKQLWPAGEYRFEGCTIEGQPITSSVTLSHDFPAGPQILAPADEASVAADEQLPIQWAPADEPPEVELVRYQVLVVNEDAVPPAVFAIDLPATATGVRVPAGFLTPGIEHKVEMLAIEASGNQTLSEVTLAVE
jgi:hypothetical protein